MAKRVLVVDDAIFMRNMIKDIFASGGFEVVGEAANGLEAVERYRELKPDLTTMDIVMPFKSGIEATREILKADAGAVVIMCSALGQESLVMEAIEAGAADFIVKPFRAEDVLGVVKKVLGDVCVAACSIRFTGARPDAGHVQVPRALRVRGHGAPGGAGARPRAAGAGARAGPRRLDVPPRPLGEGHGREHGLRERGHARPPRRGRGGCGPHAISPGWIASWWISSGQLRRADGAGAGGPRGPRSRCRPRAHPAARDAAGGPGRPRARRPPASLGQRARPRGREWPPQSRRVRLPPVPAIAAPPGRGGAGHGRAGRAPAGCLLELQVAASCQVPGVRAFLVHKRLAALGQVVALRPPLEDLKAGRIPEGRFAAELETEQRRGGRAPGAGQGPRGGAHLLRSGRRRPPRVSRRARVREREPSAGRRPAGPPSRGGGAHGPGAHRAARLLPRHGRRAAPGDVAAARGGQVRPRGGAGAARRGRGPAARAGEGPARQGDGRADDACLGRDRAPSARGEGSRPPHRPRGAAAALPAPRSSWTARSSTSWAIPCCTCCATASITGWSRRRSGPPPESPPRAASRSR